VNNNIPIEKKSFRVGILFSHNLHKD